MPPAMRIERRLTPRKSRIFVPMLIITSMIKVDPRHIVIPSAILCLRVALGLKFK